MNWKGVWITLKRNVWRIAFALFCLSLLTSHFSFQYAARYVARDSGEDGARVARFAFVLTADFTLDTQILTIEDMKPGDSYSYSITLTNASEVVLVGMVSAKNVTGNLPLTAETVSKTVNPGGSVEVTFVIEWDAEQNSPSYMGKADVLELTVSVAQVD